MPLDYGVLRGRIDRFEREDDFNTPHLQVHVKVEGGPTWRVPVNVLSKDESFLVFHRTDPFQGHSLLEGLAALPQGFTPLPPSARSATTSLDYFRAPPFDWSTGIAAPHTGPGVNDDLQDLLITDLRLLREREGDVFAFGAKFPSPGLMPGTSRGRRPANFIHAERLT